MKKLKQLDMFGDCGIVAEPEVELELEQEEEIDVGQLDMFELPSVKSWAESRQRGHGIEIVTSRRFRRSVTLGMKVWRSETYNLTNDTHVLHIEMACPSHELTERGPVMKRKKETEDDAG